jgi:ribosomal protein S27E
MQSEPCGKPVDNYDWAAAERAGYRSGHLVCRCPKCGLRQMVAYRPKLVARCRVCTPYVKQSEKPILEVISDPARLRHKRPGHPRPKGRLTEDGMVVIDPTLLRSSDGSAPA